MRYACKQDQQAETWYGDNTFWISTVYRWSRSKNAVSMGFMTLAEYEIPLAILVIELKQYALQRHRDEL